MSFYDDMQNVASDVLKQFQQGVIKYVDITSGTGPADDPGEPTENEFILDGAARGVKFKYVQNGFAVASDLQITSSLKAKNSSGSEVILNPAMSPKLVNQVIRQYIKTNHQKININEIKNGAIVNKQIDDEEKVPWHPTIEITEADNVAEPSLVIQFLQVALIPSLEQTLSRMPRAITGPGRNKWIAIAAIIQCRRIWELRTQLSAPKQLNAAGPMERFCRDIFEVLEIDIEPTSAFNAWRRTVKD